MSKTTERADRPPADELRRLYHDEDLTQAEIGDRHGVSHQIVSRWFSHYGIETGHKHGRATGTDKPRERRCGECNRRVTQSPTDETIEYGHSKGREGGGDRCSQRPADLDSSAPGSDRWDGGDE